MTLTEAAVLEELRQIYASQVDASRVVEPRHELAADLAIDSLSALTLVIGLEDRFCINLREEDAPTVKTVADLVALVVRRLEEAGS